MSLEEKQFGLKGYYDVYFSESDVRDAVMKLRSRLLHERSAAFKLVDLCANDMSKQFVFGGLNEINNCLKWIEEYLGFKDSKEDAKE